MPVFEFDEMEDVRIVDGEKLLNYWGYSPVCFFFAQYRVRFRYAAGQGGQ